MPPDQDDGRGLRAQPGVYVLVLRIAPRRHTIEVGSLGEIHFEPGYYCYVGSALNGLQSRLRRHFRRSGKRRHWHVDYLRAGSMPVGAIQWPTERRVECELSHRVERVAEGSIRGFGATDCRCSSHLHYFSAPPLERLVRIRIGEITGEVVRRVDERD